MTYLYKKKSGKVNRIMEFCCIKAYYFFFILNRKKKLPTKDLTLFINALTVACIDPKDFFGINLVDELRKRVNNSNHTKPFSILTLCNAKDTMTTDDVLKLQQQYDAHFRPVWTGMNSQ